MSRAPRNAYDGHRDAQASSSKSARLSGGLDAEPNPTPDEIKQRQNEAAEILNDWERLAMRAVANNESIPQTRLALEKVLAGYKDPPGERPMWVDLYGVPWEEYEKGVEEREKALEEMKRAQEAKGQSGQATGTDRGARRKLDKLKPRKPSGSGRKDGRQKKG